MSKGKILINSFQLKNNEILNINKSGRNRIRVEIKNFSTANAILNSDLLNSRALRAYIPETSLCRKGVIRAVDPGLSNDEIVNVIQTLNSIKDLRRMTRKIEHDGTTKIINTQTVVITFRGQDLPDFVSIYGAKCTVSPYVYRVRQCEKCFLFVHTSRQCKTKIRCKKCGEKHYTDTCTKFMGENPYCINCTRQLQACQQNKINRNIQKMARGMVSVHRCLQNIWWCWVRIPRPNAQQKLQLLISTFYGLASSCV